MSEQLGVFEHDTIAALRSNEALWDHENRISFREIFEFEFCIKHTVSCSFTDSHCWNATNGLEPKYYVTFGKTKANTNSLLYTFMDKEDYNKLHSFDLIRTGAYHGESDDVYNPHKRLTFDERELVRPRTIDLVLCYRRSLEEMRLLHNKRSVKKRENKPSGLRHDIIIMNNEGEVYPDDALLHYGDEIETARRRFDEIGPLFSDSVMDGMSEWEYPFATGRSLPEGFKRTSWTDVGMPYEVGEWPKGMYDRQWERACKLAEINAPKTKPFLLRDILNTEGDSINDKTLPDMKYRGVWIFDLGPIQEVSISEIIDDIDFETERAWESNEKEAKNGLDFKGCSRMWKESCKENSELSLEEKRLFGVGVKSSKGSKISRKI